MIEPPYSTIEAQKLCKDVGARTNYTGKYILMAI